MPIFNFLEDFLALDIAIYIMMSYTFYGLNLCVKKLIRGHAEP